MQLKKSLKNLGVKTDIYFVTVQPVEAFLNSIIVRIVYINIYCIYEYTVYILPAICHAGKCGA